LRAADRRPAKVISNAFNVEVDGVECADAVFDD
jgi:hypothetical protein